MYAREKEILNLTGYHEAGHIVLHVYFGFEHSGVVLYGTCDAQLEPSGLPSTDNETVYKYLVVRRASFYSQQRSTNRSPQDRIKAVETDTEQQQSIAGLLYVDLASDAKTNDASDAFVTSALAIVDREAKALVNSAPVACAVKKVRELIQQRHKVPQGQSAVRISADELTAFTTAALDECQEANGPVPELQHLTEFTALCDAVTIGAS